MPSDIDALVRQAAETYGLDPKLLSQIIGVESGGNPLLRSDTSSASGLFQMLKGDWREYGRGGNVFDPAANVDAGARMTLDNIKGLQAAGHEAHPGNVYLAHFAGLGGAKKLLASDPSASVESVLGKKVVEANSFLKGMTVGDLQSWAHRKMGEAPSVYAPAAETNPLVQRILSEDPLSEMSRLERALRLSQSMEPQTAAPRQTAVPATQNPLLTPGQVQTLSTQGAQPPAAQPSLLGSPVNQLTAGAGALAPPPILDVMGSTARRSFATGGRPPVGEVVRVGEAGPEDVVLDRPGTVVPTQIAAKKDLDVRTPPPLPMLTTPSVAPHNPMPPGGGPYTIQPGRPLPWPPGPLTDLPEDFPSQREQAIAKIPQERWDSAYDKAQNIAASQGLRLNHETWAHALHGMARLHGQDLPEGASGPSAKLIKALREDPDIAGLQRDYHEHVLPLHDMLAGDLERRLGVPKLPNAPVTDRGWQVQPLSPTWQYGGKGSPIDTRQPQGPYLPIAPFGQKLGSAATQRLAEMRSEGDIKGTYSGGFIPDVEVDNIHELTKENMQKHLPGLDPSDWGTIQRNKEGGFGIQFLKRPGLVS